MTQLQELISNIKRNRAGGSKATAQKVTHIFSNIIQSDTWKNATELLKIIKQMGTKLMAADPMAFYIGNIVKRITHIIWGQAKTSNIPYIEESESNNEEVSYQDI